MHRLLVVALMAIGIMLACGRAEARQSFMPENNLNLEDRYYATSMDQNTFNRIIDRFESVYAPIVAGFGARLEISGDFFDSTVNAYAERDGNIWKLHFFGGLARRPEIGEDSFLTVICHEGGHLLGGWPVYPGDTMANEGQSDYWASHVCLKKIFASDTTNVATLSATAVTRCKKLYKGQDLRACYHIMSGAQGTSNLLAALGGERKPRFDTPDKTKVSQTQAEHPAAQCRLDTMSAGALCQAPWRDDILPARSNQATYNCTINNDNNFPVVRPRCWFAP